VKDFTGEEVVSWGFGWALIVNGCSNFGYRERSDRDVGQSRGGKGQYNFSVIDTRYHSLNFAEIIFCLQTKSV
jgi:hypothetical protein